MRNLSLILVLYNFLIVFWYKLGIVQGIIGGYEAAPNQFGYLVSVRADLIHICGGSIIGERHVLTAAHCVIDEDGNFKRKQRLSVAAGIISIDTRINPRIEVNVETVHVPKEFIRIKPDRLTTYYDEEADIAVLKLKDTLDISPNSGLNVLKLPSKKSSNRYVKFCKERPFVMGFGGAKIINQRGVKRDRNDYPINTYKLTFAEALVVRKDNCKKTFPIPITENHLCAQILQHNSKNPEGACYGDTGSPLVLGEDTIIGILAQHRDDCNEQFGASLYTRITPYMKFIDRAVKDGIPSHRVATYKVVKIVDSPQEDIEELIEDTERFKFIQI